MKQIYQKILIIGAAITFPLMTMAQDLNISGTVLDSNGDPVAGASVVVKGTTTGVTTGVNGDYDISAPPDATLTFSFLGMGTMEEAVGGRARIDVKMGASDQSIEEVVVVGYGTLDKKLVTGSIKSVKQDDLMQGTGGSTIGSALVGKVAGLVIDDDGSANAGVTLQLRGMASMNASRAPLVVIDGMPGGDMRSLVQEDIVSIDVLKDASAGAIYGTRATGGVILITTTQGAEGKLRGRYTGEARFKQAFGKPKMMTAAEFKQYRPEVQDYGDDVDWWQEALNDNPVSQRHTISLQGGSKYARLYASVMYRDERGILYGDSRKDYSGRLNGAFKLFDGWLDINTHLAYMQAQREQHTPSMRHVIAQNPTRSPYDPNDVTGFNRWTRVDDDNYNALADAYFRQNGGTDAWLRPDVQFKLNILPISGLSYNHTVGYEHRSWEKYTYDNMYNSNEVFNNRRGSATLGYDKSILLNTDGYLSYVKEIGKHNINAVAGYSYYQFDSENFEMTNRDFAVDNVGVWDIGKGTWRTDASKSVDMSSNKAITQKLLAMFARGVYSYDQKYTATATFRREGSSKFAVNKRWGNFWSVGGSWRASNESFIKDNAGKWLSDLNLRMGYGITGNEGFSADYAAKMLGSDTNFPMLDGSSWQYSYGVKNNINPDLGWEERHELNIGIDAAFFDNRLWARFDVYNRNVEGLIYSVNVSQPPNVLSTMHKNIGSLKSTGWELELGGNVVQTADWKYTTSLNLSHNSVTMGKMATANTFIKGDDVGWAGTVHRIEENVKVGSFWLYRFAGFQDGKFMIYDKDGNVVDGAANKNDENRVYTGNYLPLLSAGWTHNLKWKDGDLNVVLTSNIKFDVFNHSRMRSEFKTGSNDINRSPEAYTTNGEITGAILATDNFLEDGTFLKIQSITLGYTLKTQQWLKHLESVRIYAAGYNLYRFTKYSGLNPEVNITGWEGGIGWYDPYPQTRTLTLGLQLNF